MPNILYTGGRLQKIKLSNDIGHICQNDNNGEAMQHVLFSCST